MIRLGIIGVKGFASAHHAAALELERAGHCRLVAVTEPDAPPVPGGSADGFSFAERGVRCFDDYRDMLAQCAEDCDVVTVPTPIHLHAPMHADCVAHGVACYLEKPPTQVWDEFTRMLETERRAARDTAVGFNFIAEPERRALKERLLSGELGAVRRVTYRGLWGRPESYYRRTNWSGRLFLDGYPVLDSSLGNAMAHQVHNVLFWCGRHGLYSWGDPAELESELYRVHDIESPDTLFVRGTTAGGAALALAVSHACAPGWRTEETVECERAVITYRIGRSWSVAWRDGRREHGELAEGSMTAANFRHYFDYVEGREVRPWTRLADAAGYVRFHGLVYLAAGGITPAGPAFYQAVRGPRGGTFRILDGVEDAATRLVREGRLPSEDGVAWSRPGGRAVAADLAALPSALAALVDRPG